MESHVKYSLYHPQPERTGLDRAERPDEAFHEAGIPSRHRAIAGPDWRSLLRPGQPAAGGRSVCDNERQTRSVRQMKMIARYFLLVAILALPALPQSTELGISVGYGSLRDSDLSVRNFDDPAGREAYSLSDGVRVGGRMVFNTRLYLSHEISYAYQHSGLNVVEEVDATVHEQDLGAVRTHNMFYNLQLHALPAGSPFRPFVTGGGGFTSFFLPGVPSFSGYGDTKFGYNYGAGIKINLFTYGFRIDVRNHTTGKPFGQYLPNVEGTLNNLEFSVTYSLLM